MYFISKLMMEERMNERKPDDYGVANGDANLLYMPLSCWFKFHLSFSLFVRLHTAMREQIQLFMVNGLRIAIWLKSTTDLKQILYYHYRSFALSLFHSNCSIYFVFHYYRGLLSFISVYIDVYTVQCTQQSHWCGYAEPRQP